MGKRFFLDDDGQLQKQANGLFSKGYVKVKMQVALKNSQRWRKALHRKTRFALANPEASIFSVLHQLQRGRHSRHWPIGR